MQKTYGVRSQNPEFSLCIRMITWMSVRNGPANGFRADNERALDQPSQDQVKLFLAVGTRRPDSPDSETLN